ncbi:hypothetical protein [Clostridium estertheticum]|uniref:Uncharacterized protein n=1 Tax=Clostridium estertheticum TaxID=238834 RepID=A0AA47I7Y1_9CLOT|nr:hypothetical protein [Clostridium estertheticum]MBU3153911.1 hypothetical protein [Clostridium estertheticum]WAG61315.1 hypothetical protein LL038_03415 [Clostridium estertheticum]
MHKNKMKIRESSKPNSIIEEMKPDEYKGNIVVDFSNPFSLYSCAVKGVFTNYLRSKNDIFDNYQKIFNQVLKYFSENTFNDMRSRKKETHTHEIKDQDKIDIVKKILKELISCQAQSTIKVDTIVKNLVADADLWQLSYPNGMRFIGSRNGNVMTLFFVDYHHLIYPNKNYNNKDFFSYKCCLMNELKNELAESEIASDVQNND